MPYASGDNSEVRAMLIRDPLARGVWAVGATRAQTAPAGEHARPAAITTTELCAGQGGEPSERDGTSPPNLPFGCAAPHALHERSRDPVTRGAVSGRNGRLGGPTKRCSCRREGGRCPRALSLTFSRALQTAVTRRGWAGYFSAFQSIAVTKRLSIGLPATIAGLNFHLASVSTD